MKRRRFLAALGTGILSLSAGCMFTSTPGQCQAGFPPSRTAGGVQRLSNIVVLIADDLGWNDIRYHGSEIRAPNLDKLWLLRGCAWSITTSILPVRPPVQGC
jgi:hypothetical protein